jgi:indoleamine 2,3-dioxygenase
MPPVLVYATYNLMNWRRLDPQGPLELGNLAVQHVSALLMPWVCE